MMVHSVAEAGYGLGITKGVGGGRFHPFAPISRAEAITMLIRAAMQLGPQPLPLGSGFHSTLPNPDNPNHAHNVLLAEKNELLAHLVGLGPGWDPRRTMSRGEAAQVLANLLE